jgi:L-amino acid N-acyltransferase YncA
MKKAETESTVVRPVAESDVNAVVALVQELAPYEQASDQYHLPPAQLRTALFGEAPALFGYVAEVGCEVVAFALWFRNFSTWDVVHGIYLEDLFVRSKHRGCGLSRALSRSLPPSACATGISGCSGGSWTGTGPRSASPVRSAPNR